MKKQLSILITLFALTLTTRAQSSFTLKSNDIGGQMTPVQESNSYGCNGQNISPQLSWVNPPKGTQSYAITMFDPAAPTGSGWWHWVIFDIPGFTRALFANAGNPIKNLLPKGSIQSNTDAGKPGYDGPCPPEGHGFHPYIITIYALKSSKLGLDQHASAAQVGFMLNNNAIEKASIMAYYKREPNYAAK